MKLAFGFLILVLSLNILACEQYEAQFAGYVSVVDGIDEQKGCELKIDFEVYNMHFFCPLLAEEVQNHSIVADAKTCELLKNSRSGGILVKRVDSDQITIEL